MEKKGRNWRGKYLTKADFGDFKADFEDWKEHHFKSLVKKVWRIEGILYVLVPLVLAILAIAVALLLR